MLAIETLTEEQWKTVYDMARILANEQTDINELGKIIAYLRAYGHVENAGKNFFQYLGVLVKNGKSVGHSGKTLEYYQSIDKACKQHLFKYQNNVAVMLQILGWVARMMRYYKAGGSTDFVEEAVITRQDEIAQVLLSQELKIDDILEAAVTNIKGVEVTYTILNSIRTTQKEHKKASSLSVGQVVKVKIIELKNGRPKKLLLVD